MQSFEMRRLPLRGHEFREDVRSGLTAATKSIPPRWFYDELGSVLFDAICLLPEYYVTRAETEVFEAHAREIVAALDHPSRVVELGAGTARKTRLLLRHLGRCEYVPVDIDGAMVEKTGRKMTEEFDDILVTGVCGDFTDPAAILRALDPTPGPTAALFLGSTIGNLDLDSAIAMLRATREQMRPGDRFLLGADLRKDHAVLHAAYNDALGVTAAFNLNLLQRINAELGGRFELDRFRHRALFNEELGRIEMYLDSTAEQSVRIEAIDLDVEFAEGEPIHTENSYKYTRAGLEALAEAGGFTVTSFWTDSRGWFADAMLVAV